MVPLCSVRGVPHVYGVSVSCFLVLEVKACFLGLSGLNGDSGILLHSQPTAYGVFLLNSNAMDVSISSTQQLLTFETIGGILDFHIVSGPSPLDVIRQFSDVLGKPNMPSYWSLGWHQCRWGYRTVQDVQAVVSQYQTNNLPVCDVWCCCHYTYSRYVSIVIVVVVVVVESVVFPGSCCCHLLSYHVVAAFAFLSLWMMHICTYLCVCVFVCVFSCKGFLHVHECTQNLVMVVLRVMGAFLLCL